MFLKHNIALRCWKKNLTNSLRSALRENFQPTHSRFSITVVRDCISFESRAAWRTWSGHDSIDYRSNYSLGLFISKTHKQPQETKYFTISKIAYKIKRNYSIRCKRKQNVVAITLPGVKFNATLEGWGGIKLTWSNCFYRKWKHCWYCI